ncbi:hypothetical protein Ciccas_002305 [Cichlidogyrus casuarinus]|uniref:Cadherin domain-containing protein n=1 Tax=Cichlidogyrus casuarinus TaxID=1844966 RepID=A0ABD2QHM5_9PLAT
MISLSWRLLTFQIGAVRAVDQDAENKHRQMRIYLEEESGAEAKKYLMVQSNGEIYTRNQPLDREKIDKLSFNVIAQDADSYNSSIASVTISIDDENDNYPQWVDNKLALNVSLFTESRTILTKVRAVDADKGPNGRIEYSIVGGNVDNYFALDPISGSLLLNRAFLVNENASSVISQVFSLQLQAADQGEPKKYNRTLLTIYIRGDMHPSYEEAVDNDNYRTGKSFELDRDLVIMLTMIAITLLISMVLILAIWMLRCKHLGPFTRRFRNPVSPSNTGQATINSWKYSTQGDYLIPNNVIADDDSKGGTILYSTASNYNNISTFDPSKYEILLAGKKNNTELYSSLTMKPASPVLYVQGATQTTSYATLKPSLRNKARVQMNENCLIPMKPNANSSLELDFHQTQIN